MRISPTARANSPACKPVFPGLFWGGLERVKKAQQNQAATFT